MSLFFQGKKEYKAQSLQAIAWKKFCKNKQGMFLLCFLVIITIIASLGYLITPDSTPYANEQILEIRLMKPMSKVSFLEVKKKHYVEKRNIIKKMLEHQRAVGYHLLVITTSSQREYGLIGILCTYLIQMILLLLSAKK